MKINKIDKIDSKKGDYILLSDFGSEGIAVSGQYKDIEAAVLGLGNDCSSSQAIVKLVDIYFSVSD